MTEPDDRMLADALLRTGDRDAFGRLYDRHTPYLYRLALRLSGADEQAAEDLVHDAWVAATSRLSTFRWKASLRTWLAGFVVNGARAGFRAGDRTLPLGDAPVRTDDRALTSAHDRIDLERAIATLPAGARHVLVLHDVEGWTHADIGRHLGIEAGTSKSQLSRARALLRGQLTTEERTAE